MAHRVSNLRAGRIMVCLAHKGCALDVVHGHGRDHRRRSLGTLRTHSIDLDIRSTATQGGMWSCAARTCPGETPTCRVTRTVITFKSGREVEACEPWICAHGRMALSHVNYKYQYPDIILSGSNVNGRGGLASDRQPYPGLGTALTEDAGQHIGCTSDPLLLARVCGRKAHK